MKPLVAAVAALVALAACAPEIDAVRTRAEQGDAVAQTNLGNMYADGEGVPEDDTEAVRWFRLAADQGDTQAQYSLALMYGNGRGVAQDDVQAPCGSTSSPRSPPAISETWP